MTDEVGGVRDHLANERTQLAWLRTGANVMLVGLAAELRRGHADSVTSSAGPTLAAVLALTAIVAATVLVLAST